MTGRHPKKGLGQHFLTDRNVLDAVAEAGAVGAGDAVIEVGSGPGTLTAVLAARAREVIAVELDADLADELAGRAPANVRVVTADARAALPQDLLGGCRRYKLVGNLPYYAAMPILRAFLESACPPARAAVLLQREVAAQVCARPGSMSLVSLGVQLFGSPRITRLVRPGSFHPPPKVTSAVVAIAVHGAPAEGVDDAGRFFTLARAGFSAPRKQLRNALGAGLGIGAGAASALLDRGGIDPQRRPATLSMAEWGALYRAWRERGG